MKNIATTMTVTKDALIVRIPWKAVTERMKAKFHMPRLTTDDVLKIVEEGRQAYKCGRARVVKTLSELQS